jgi:hypothetical protein
MTNMIKKDETELTEEQAERAAIMEFDGGLSRDEAERLCKIKKHYENKEEQ